MTQQSHEQVFTWGNKTWVHSQKDLCKEKKNVYSGFTHNSLNLETVPVFINRKTDEQTDTFLS